MASTTESPLALAARHARERNLMLPVHCRQIIRRDIAALAAIEAGSFADPWTGDDIGCRLRGRRTDGLLADYGGHVAGYMVFEVERSSLRLVRFAVHPDCRRVRIGWQMVGRLRGEAETCRRDRIAADVPESLLGTQLFFKAMGFRAAEVLRGRHGGEDAYRMVWRVHP